MNKVEKRKAMLTEAISNIIYSGTKSNKSITSKEIARKAKYETGYDVSRRSVAKYVKTLINSGENIISFRNGPLRGYRYSESPMEYYASMNENIVMVSAFQNKVNRLMHRRDKLLDDK